MNQKPVQNRKRFWFRFSLRSLFLVVLSVCLVSGYVAYERRKADQTRRAFEEIGKLNGIIRLHDDSPHRPDWLKPLLGDDAYSFVSSMELSGDLSAHVTDSREPTDEKLVALKFLTRAEEISFANLTIHDETLAVLRNFRNLKSISLRSCPLITDEGLKNLVGLGDLEVVSLEEMDLITDKGLAFLATLPRLKGLYLSGTGISDEGLRHIAASKQLQRLRLDESRLTHEGMKSLSDLSGLTVLSLQNVPIGDRGLAHLEKLGELEVLDLYGTKVTDRSLPIVGRMQKLESLHLGTAVAATDSPAARRSLAVIPADASRSGITDEGLKQLQELTNLKSLDLSNSRVTDEGLFHLRNLAKLSRLDLTGTDVTDAGLAHLEQLPELNLLDVEFTSVTEEGARNLAAKLDNVHVSITKDGQHRNVGKDY